MSLRPQISARRPVTRTVTARLSVARLLRHRPPPFRRRLYTSAEVSPGRMLLRRVGLLGLLLLAVFIVFWLDRAGLEDEHDGTVSLLDVVYFTFVTVTTVGYGDIVPVSDRARIVDALFVTPVRLFVLLLFLGTAYELVLRRAMEEFRMRRLQKRLNGHIVICGFGTVGRMAAEELVLRGAEPGAIVVVDVSNDALEIAAESGLLGLHGDATEASVLHDAAIARARAVLVCSGRDDTSVLVCLATRTAAPDVRIVATVKNPRQAPLMAQSGANLVLSPSGLGGRILAEAVDNSNVAAILADLASARGEATLLERFPSQGELGRMPREIGPGVVLAIRRGGDLLWAWHADAARIEPEDRLVLVVPAGGPAA